MSQLLHVTIDSSFTDEWVDNAMVTPNCLLGPRRVFIEFLTGRQKLSASARTEPGAPFAGSESKLNLPGWSS